MDGELQTIWGADFNRHRGARRHRPADLLTSEGRTDEQRQAEVAREALHHSHVRGTLADEREATHAQPDRCPSYPRMSLDLVFHPGHHLGPIVLVEVLCQSLGRSAQLWQLLECVADARRKLAWVL